MIEKRPSAERGHANHGWLNTYHTFSFADYHDPQHVHFRSLRVINEDYVAAGRGFGSHPHRDMEIITYILEGALEHKDSMGNGSIIRPGEVQRMSAGTGVFHSEYNPSPSDPTHLLQIWLFPEAHSLPPSYEQKNFTTEERTDTLRLVASPDGRDGSVTIHQDALVYASFLNEGKLLEHDFASGRGGYLQLVTGALAVGGTTLEAGDGLAITDEVRIAIRSTSNVPAHFILFDLA